MRTIVKGSGGVHEVSVEAILEEKRTIYLEGEINYESAMNFVRQVMYFVQEDEMRPIKVFITSHGGCIDAGMIIYDVIQTSKVPIELYCIGMAYSMAALIFSCGKHGRYILPHSKLMLHEPLIPYGVGGKSSSVRTISESLLQTKQELEEIISKHTGQTMEAVEEITRTDHYFKAQEAVDFGLADAIRGFDDMLKESA